MDILATRIRTAKTLCGILGIPENSSQDAKNHEYRTLCVLVHPDKLKDDQYKDLFHTVSSAKKDDEATIAVVAQQYRRRTIQEICNDQRTLLRKQALSNANYCKRHRRQFTTTKCPRCTNAYETIQKSIQDKKTSARLAVKSFYDDTLHAC